MIKYVFFDLDGTLADTEEIIVKSFKHIHEKFNSKIPDKKEIVRNFGEPLKNTIEREFKNYDYDEVVDEYRNHHRNIFYDYLKLHEGAADIIKYLHSDNKTLGIVTSRLRETAVEILEIFDIKKYFKTIVTIDDTEKHKPDPEPLLKALDDVSGVRDESIYIGDTKYDIECAKNTGIKSVLVGWSHHADEKEKVEPDYTIMKFSELIKIINEN